MPSQVNLDPLYNPVPTPAPLGETPQQAPVFAPAGGFTQKEFDVNATLSGVHRDPGTVTPGYGGGGATITPMAPMAPMDMSLQSTVSGAMGLDKTVEDTTTIIPQRAAGAEKWQETYGSDREEYKKRSFGQKLKGLTTRKGRKEWRTYM